MNSELDLKTASNTSICRSYYIITSCKTKFKTRKKGSENEQYYTNNSFRSRNGNSII